MGSSTATKLKSRSRCPEKRKSRLPGGVVGGDLMEKHLRAPRAPRRPVGVQPAGPVCADFQPGYSCGGRGSFPFPLRRSLVPQQLTRAGTTSMVKEPEKKRSKCGFCVLWDGSWRAVGSPSSWPDLGVDVSGPPGALRSCGVNAVVCVQPCLVQNLGCGRWGSLSVRKRGSNLLLDVKRASCASGRVGVR